MKTCTPMENANANAKPNKIVSPCPYNPVTDDIGVTQTFFSSF